jgi:Protein of Unknown function (DUF2784)
MTYRWLADLIVIAHFGFVLFVVFGGLLVLRWPALAWVHLPAAAWGAIVELTGWICPLTPLENWLRPQKGAGAYTGDFVARYVLPTLYPEGLTRETQLLLGAGVIVLNTAIYAIVIRQRSRRLHPISRM